MQVIIDPHMTEQEFKGWCRSKKKRIRKKWKKNPNNYRTVPSTEVLMFGDKCVCHPMVAQVMKETLKERQHVDRPMGMFGSYLNAALEF